MNIYQQMIIEDIKCTPEIAEELEEIMRQDIFHSTLDWLSRVQFRKGAREAKEVYDFTNSPEGIAYIEELERQMLL